MKIMNRFIGALALLLAGSSAAFAAEPEVSLTYTLPSTTISLTVEAVQENFYAGPYARFAEKYLGITAPVADRVVCHIRKVSMTPLIEADQKARRSLPAACDLEDRNILALTSAGLMSVENGSFGAERVWRFPAPSAADFSGRGLSSNLKSESATLYGASKRNTSRIILQKMTKEKTLEQKAEEAAAMILALREKRLQIITGDTDATYSGEAMGAAIEELHALEKEYLSLFIGYTECQEQTMNFDVVPQTGNERQIMVAFRLSDKEGLMPADRETGRPVVMEIVPDQMETAPLSREEAKVRAPKNSVYVHYRMPATCTVNILAEGRLLLQGRLPIFQMGTEAVLPVQLKK